MAHSQPRARIELDLLSDASSTWGHASGWAQLTGTRHNVSCLVVGITNSTGLAAVFDALSDELTEAGYPWEVVMVDAGAGAQLSDFLDSWRQRQGFRRVSLPRGTSAHVMLCEALKEARGDAVLLLSPHRNALAIDAAEMISRWSAGIEVVRSPYLDRSAMGLDEIDASPQHGLEAQALGAGTGGAGCAPEVLRHEALLLDKRIVAILLARD
jgi:hypothetical protein